MEAELGSEMGVEYQIFDSVTLKLAPGVHLVEASAGTGKTYAIAMLVLRAVVELAAPIDKILIVTFTKAATEELRARIRARLAAARDILTAASSDGENAADETLLAWAGTVKDREAAVTLLRLALVDIDRAAIFTIHGYCQRMLAEQALESGQLFEVELLTDIDQVQREIADDFWRSRIYGLDPVACCLVTSAFHSPDDLLASVTLAVKDCPVEPPPGELAPVLDRLGAALVGLRCWWQEHRSAFIERCRASIARGHFKKAIGDDCDRWFRELDDFFTGNTHAMPDAVRHLHRTHLTAELNGNKVRGEEKKEAYLADWALPDTLVDELYAAAGDLRLTLRVQLAERLRREVSRRLMARGTMGFDDLILRLAEALAGERGGSLRTVLGDRFAVALIDEFQDTDSAQWSIFASVFGGGKHFLYLIGDPKQAIYKFRGADIHSYFQAKAAADRLLTLARNYRSHPLLVAEVNRLFLSRENPFHFSESLLGYLPVAAAKNEQDAGLTRDGQSLAGMVYCILPPAEDDRNGRRFSTAAGDRFRDFVIAEIARLLDPVAKVIHPADHRPLASREIAVLVRSNFQAEEYREALVRAGIPAVLNSRQSVFHTAECRDLMLVLQAIASPGETVKLRTALTISWFGFTGNYLYELWRDEEGLGNIHRRFLEYNRAWQEEGFLAMMSRLLVAEEVLVKLAAGRMAERAIANIHHLLELVQEEETAGNLGIGEVLQWLGRMMADDRGGENGELLLESDEEAVRLVTMHGAKGLEFPVVFCPYLWYRSNRLKNETLQISCHDVQGPVVDLGSERFLERKELALAEEMAEDLRLLYVALTRAGSRCYTMWADVKAHSTVADSFHSALGYLLFPEGHLSPEAQEESLAALVRDHGVELVRIDDTHVRPAPPPSRAVRELRPLAPSGRSLFTDWQLSSFSALAMQSEYDGEAAPVVHHTGRPIPFPGLPSGPGFGNVIHDLLQNFSFSAIARQELGGEAVQERCDRFGVNIDPEQAAGLLQLVVKTPLAIEGSGDTFSLAGLGEEKCVKEMAFYYRLGRTATDRINAALAADPTVVPVGHRTMQGFLTGFVDLVCVYRGRYYVIDYKTNFLGDNLADYRPDRLVGAMQSHNYGLQYWIYTLVLHRHLAHVLPGYSYGDHFGGVFYLFLRGMTPEVPGSGVFATSPDYETLVLLERATGGGTDE